MQPANLKLSCKQVIDQHSKGFFAEQVFHASYREFLLKSQNYNKEGDLVTFSQMKLRDGRANSLHYKTGFAADGFISLLQHRMPVCSDTLGQSLVFETYRFELIESDINQQASHAVAIHYITAALTLLNQFGEWLLLAPGDRTAQLANPTEPIEDSFLLKLQPLLSIVQYQPVQSLAVAQLG